MLEQSEKFRAHLLVSKTNGYEYRAVVDLKVESHSDENSIRCAIIENVSLQGVFIFRNPKRLRSLKWGEIGPTWVSPNAIEEIDIEAITPYKETHNDAEEAPSAQEIH